MISVQQARAAIEATVSRGPSASVPLLESLSRVIASDVTSSHDYPLFTASAMDGVALCHEDTAHATSAHPVLLTLRDSVMAGDVPTESLQSGCALRIMTGAMLPPGATTVMMQEEAVFTSDGRLRVTAPIPHGQHVRRAAEDVCAGDVVLRAGTAMTPAAIGFAAALGIAHVPIIAPPRVAVVPTGSELVRDAAQLHPGAIFESNAVALEAALRQIGIVPTVSAPVADDAAALSRAIAAQLASADVLLISGGVSVGARDLVKELLQANGVETVFWRVAQKPGKPLFFGRRGRQLVFGLPGNPVSALVCYAEYVQPALRTWMGAAHPWPRDVSARVQSAVSHKPGRTSFLRAVADRAAGQLRVSPLAVQESHRLRSFAEANCLLVMPPDVAAVAAGDDVIIHWLQPEAL